jgi:hypothetical protein
MMSMMVMALGVLLWLLPVQNPSARGTQAPSGPQGCSDLDTVQYRPAQPDALGNIRLEVSDEADGNRPRVPMRRGLLSARRGS